MLIGYFIVGTIWGVTNALMGQESKKSFKKIE